MSLQAHLRFALEQKIKTRPGAIRTRGKQTFVIYPNDHLTQNIKSQFTSKPTIPCSTTDRHGHHKICEQALFTRAHQLGATPNTKANQLKPVLIHQLIFLLFLLHWCYSSTYVLVTEARLELHHYHPMPPFCISLTRLLNHLSWAYFNHKNVRCFVQYPPPSNPASLSQSTLQCLDPPYLMWRGHVFPRPAHPPDALLSWLSDSNHLRPTQTTNFKPHARYSRNGPPHNRKISRQSLL